MPGMALAADDADDEPKDIADSQSGCMSATTAHTGQFKVIPSAKHTPINISIIFKENKIQYTFD